MPFSRTQPSPRYRALVELYREMHLKGERFLGKPPEKTFEGRSLLPQATRIKRLVQETGAQTILDYGSGKGMAYDEKAFVVKGVGRFDSVLDYWEVDHVTCYDPAYPPFSTLPEGKYDGVICTDVLEHCPEEDMPWIVGELFGYAERFVFVNAACFPANKRLPTGENAHCTIQPPEWWEALFRRIGSRHPGVTWELWVANVAEEGSSALRETCIRG